MKLLAQARSLLAGYRLLRRLVQTQDAILAQQQAQTFALQSLAASVRLLVQQEIGAGAGFVTGPADGREESALVRQSDQEIAELLSIESMLFKRLGRQPLEAETVAAWEEWRSGG